MRVADLTKEELKALISEVIEEKFRELFDPDYGLEIREDFAERLDNSIASKERIPFEVVMKKLGINPSHP
jgi:DNA primase large subunit